VPSANEGIGEGEDVVSINSLSQNPSLGGKGGGGRGKGGRKRGGHASQYPGAVAVFVFFIFEVRGRRVVNRKDGGRGGAASNLSLRRDNAEDREKKGGEKIGGEVGRSLITRLRRDPDEKGEGLRPCHPMGADSVFSLRSTVISRIPTEGEGKKKRGYRRACLGYFGRGRDRPRGATEPMRGKEKGGGEKKR